jgi:hypothetical protein
VYQWVILGSSICHVALFAHVIICNWCLPPLCLSLAHARVLARRWDPELCSKYFVCDWDLSCTGPQCFCTLQHVEPGDFTKHRQVYTCHRRELTEPLVRRLGVTPTCMRARTHVCIVMHICVCAHVHEHTHTRTHLRLRAHPVILFLSTDIHACACAHACMPTH